MLHEERIQGVERKSSSMNRPELLSAEDAAQMLGIGSKRLRILINEKRIYAQLVGNSWVLFKEDVIEFKSKKRKRGRPSKPDSI